MNSRADFPDPLILRFYRVKNGELVCRVTETGTNRAWLVREAEAVHTIIYSEMTVEGRRND